MKNSTTRSMIRFGKLSLILMTIIFIISCSGSSNKTATQKDSTGSGNSKEESKKDVDLSVVATDACDCISDFENALSDKAKDLVIEASKNGGMDTVTKSFTDKDKEVWSSEGAKSRNCLKQLEKKYPGLKKSADYKKALEEHCSEFAAAIN